MAADDELLRRFARDAPQASDERAATSACAKRSRMERELLEPDRLRRRPAHRYLAHGRARAARAHPPARRAARRRRAVDHRSSPSASSTASPAMRISCSTRARCPIPTGSRACATSPAATRRSSASSRPRPTSSALIEDIAHLRRGAHSRIPGQQPQLPDGRGRLHRRPASLGVHRRPARRDLCGRVRRGDGAAQRPARGQAVPAAAARRRRRQARRTTAPWAQVACATPGAVITCGSFSPFMKAMQRAARLAWHRGSRAR